MGPPQSADKNHASGASSKAPTEPEPGAGGLVWRRVRGRWCVALVERTPAGGNVTECSLPKGHIADGETPEHAALREVAEEVGWRAQLLKDLGSFTYEANGRHRVIHMWSMEAVREVATVTQPAEQNGERITKRRWVSPREAIARLTHDEQAVFLAAHAPAGSTAAGARKRRWRHFGSFADRRKRLVATIDVYEAELEAAKLNGANAGNAPELATAIDLVRRGRERFDETGDVNEGWQFVYAAYRHEALTLDSADAESLRQELLAEADKKLAGTWRGTAIKEQLAAKADDKNPKELNRRLAGAVKLRDGHAGNVYRRLDQTRRQLTLLGVIAAVLLVVLVGLLISSVIPTSATADPLVFLGVALFGALGGAFSGAISVMRGADAKHPIPEGLITEMTTLMRPVVGAVGAVAIFVFLDAGLLGSLDTPGAYAAGFAAGFSERLVSRVAESTFAP